ncbi:MAG: hypothetical protein HYV38_02830 [Candidatus Levybacteria bacterium]|nr:hypothetical protein [Candidatus Levybacteria bacterium]
MSVDNDRRWQPITKTEAVLGMAAAGVLTVVVGLVLRDGGLLVPRGANAAEQEFPREQIIYVYLSKWDCNQENIVGQVDRGVIDYTKPDVSMSDGIILFTYPAIDENGNRFPKTVAYEDPGLKPGDTLGYYSDSRDCPLPEGVPTIPAENQ